MANGGLFKPSTREGSSQSGANQIHLCTHKHKQTYHSGRTHAHAFICKGMMSRRVFVGLILSFLHSSQQTENALKHKIRHQPECSKLVRMHILQGTTLTTITITDTPDWQCTKMLKKKKLLKVLVRYSTGMFSVETEAETLKKQRYQWYNGCHQVSGHFG